VVAFVSGAVQRFGKFHGLVNSAGIRGVGNVLDLDPEAWRTVLSVNLDGTFNVCQAFARRAPVGSRHVCFAPIAPGFVQGANERQTGKSRQGDKGEVTFARAANQYGFCPHTVTRWP
jgi:NAD(P)-dependent dehydrogenase (short-subunit alcohol dehydrogenase family)